MHEAETSIAPTTLLARSRPDVLPTKLVPPQLPQDAIVRPRLHECLTVASRRLLTIVSAPAGAGKTVLLTTWCASEEPPGPVAWVTIDRGDDESARLWRATSAAVAGALGAADTAAAGTAEVGGLISFVAKLTQPLVLVLDGVHALADPALLDELDHLLAYAPPQLRLIVSGRGSPPMSIPRLRVALQTTELDNEDLAFTADEVRRLLEARGVDIPGDEVTALHERTEGWAVAVSLAVQALERGARRDLNARAAGGDIAEYLAQEMLADQPEDVRDFLLAIAVVDEVSPALAAALTGREDAELLLARLQRESVFLTRVDRDEDAIYRYHRLVLEFLRAESKRRGTPDSRSLHARAARWYGEAGAMVPALGHAVAAADWDCAAALVRRDWPDHAIDRVPPEVGDALERVPAEVLDRSAELAAAAALILFERGRPGEAAAHVARASELLAAAPPDLADDVSPLVTLAQMIEARLTGDCDALDRTARTLLEQRPAKGVAPERRRRVQQAAAFAGLGVAALGRGDLFAAEQHLEEALELATAEGATATAVDCAGHLALVEAARGRLKHAAERAHESAVIAADRGWEGIRQTVAGELALGWARYQWDEIDSARAHLEKAAAAARAGGDRSLRVVATVVLASALASRGAEGANDGLRRLRGVLADTADWSPPPFLDGLLRSAEPRLLIARGELPEASQAMERARGAARTEPADLALVRARLDLTEGRPWDALEAVKGCLELAVPPGQLSHVIEAWLVDAIARTEVRDRDSAARSLEQALELAAPNAYRRVFVDLGPAAKAMLAGHVRRGTAHRSFVADLLLAFERRAPEVHLSKAQLLEPLSHREESVLRYLPTMMSNTEIAGELYISVNTVKTHLRNIYRKLDAHGRRDAVMRARQLELV